MRFSLQVHYAVCGLFDLAYNGLGEAVQVRVMSERQQVPARYLEQIFQRLRRAGIVAGKRGPGGGYRLARAAGAITLLEVVEAVEGPVGVALLSGSERADAAGPPGASDVHELEPGVRVPGRPDFIWPELASRFSSVLSEISLADLCRSAARRGIPRLSQPAPDYQI